MKYIQKYIQNTNTRGGVISGIAGISVFLFFVTPLSVFSAGKVQRLGSPSSQYWIWVDKEGNIKRDDEALQKEPQEKKYTNTFQEIKENISSPSSSQVRNNLVSEDSFIQNEENNKKKKSNVSYEREKEDFTNITNTGVDTNNETQKSFVKSDIENVTFTRGLGSGRRDPDFIDKWEENIEENQENQENISSKKEPLESFSYLESTEQSEISDSVVYYPITDKNGDESSRIRVIKNTEEVRNILNIENKEEQEEQEIHNSINNTSSASLQENIESRDNSDNTTEEVVNTLSKKEQETLLSLSADLQTENIQDVLSTDAIVEKETYIKNSEGEVVEIQKEQVTQEGEKIAMTVYSYTSQGENNNFTVNKIVTKNYLSNTIVEKNIERNIEKKEIIIKKKTYELDALQKQNNIISDQVLVYENSVYNTPQVNNTVRNIYNNAEKNISHIESSYKYSPRGVLSKKITTLTVLPESSEKNIQKIQGNEESVIEIVVFDTDSVDSSFEKPLVNEKIYLRKNKKGEIIEHYIEKEGEGDNKIVQIWRTKNGKTISKVSQCIQKNKKIKK